MYTRIVLLVSIVSILLACGKEDTLALQADASETFVDASSTVPVRELGNNIAALNGRRPIGKDIDKNFITSETKIVRGVPHYYEWDPIENPNHYNWCAHAGLKMLAHYHGAKHHTLWDIHKYLWDHSSLYRNDRNNDGKFIASAGDLIYAARAEELYNLPRTSDKGEIIRNLDHFIQRLKDGVDYNIPALVPSYYDEPYGHFYPVVGYELYKTSSGKILYDRSNFYLRDSRSQYPNYPDYDVVVNVKTFYQKMWSNNIIFIRP